MLRKLFCLAAGLALGGCIDIGDIVFVEAGGGGTGGSGPGGSGLGGAGGTGGDGVGGAIYRSVVMADGPLGYWRLGSTLDATKTPDETSAARHANLAQSGGEGTFDWGVAGAIANDPDTAVSLADGAALFVSAPHPFAFSEGASYSLEAWVRVSSSASAALWTCETAQSNVGYETFFLPGSVYHKRHDEAGGFDEMGIEPFAASEFVHLVVTFDGTTNEGQTFLNGGLQYLPPQMMPVEWGAHESAFYLVNTDNFGAPGGPIAVDEVAVYGVALHPDRVKKHFDCGKSGLCD